MGHHYTCLNNRHLTSFLQDLRQRHSMCTQQETKNEMGKEELLSSEPALSERGVWTTWHTRRETRLHMCLSYINRGAQVRRTRVSTSKTKQWIHLLLQSLLFPNRKCTLVSVLRAFIQPLCMQLQLPQGEKTTQLVSQHQHNTRKLYPLTKMFWELFLSFLPHGNAHHLKNCTQRLGNGWRHMYKNTYLNTMYLNTPSPNHKLRWSAAWQGGNF